MSNTIAIRNRGRSSIEFWLEPWGDGAGLPADATATVRFASDEPLELLVDVEDRVVTLWVNSQTPPEDVDSGRLFLIVGGEGA